MIFVLQNNFLFTLFSFILAIDDITIFACMKIPVCVRNFSLSVHHKGSLCYNWLRIFFTAKQNDVNAGFGVVAYFNGSFVPVKFNEFTFNKFGIVDHCIL